VKRGKIEKVTKLARWGDGLGVRIPQEVADQLKLKAGESVKVRIDGNRITICRTKTRRRWTERELLKGVRPGMCGPDLLPDRVGKELI
jgi:antitoxin MazE